MSEVNVRADGRKVFEAVDQAMIHVLEDMGFDDDGAVFNRIEANIAVLGALEALKVKWLDITREATEPELDQNEGTNGHRGEEGSTNGKGDVAVDDGGGPE